ncbi:MAG: hypothetical protein U0L77_01650 [Prevotellamassilia sp.]|nr:hypothetical protein [Prevotellamassilia sp.]
MRQNAGFDAPFFDAVNRLGNDRAVACQILTLFYNIIQQTQNLFIDLQHLGMHKEREIYTHE